jgi:arylsulfatase
LGSAIDLAPTPRSVTWSPDLSGKLESLINKEIGSDTRAWVPERPRLLGWPTWRGDSPFHPASPAGPELGVS